MLSRKVARCEEDYHIRRQRALDDYSSEIKRAVEDHLDYLNQNYPFNHGCFNQLHGVVMQQLQRVIAAQDFRHNAFEQIRHDKIDWLAEPFFKGDQLALSSLILDYDRFRQDRFYRPSASCRKLFYIHEEPASNPEAHVSLSEPRSDANSHKRERESSEWD